MVRYWFNQTYIVTGRLFSHSNLTSRPIRNLNFKVDADPDPDPDFFAIKTNADRLADPIPKFYTCWKIRVCLLLDTALSVYNVLFFASVSNVSYFSVFWTVY